MLQAHSTNRTVLIGLWIALNGIAFTISAVAAAPVSSQILADTPRIQCPSEIAPLIDRMLQDLPSYMNRVRTRAGIGKSFIVLAARPEFKPLPLSTFPDAESEKAQQVFFTTLQRRYERNRIVYLQEYHWLFLTQSPKNWQFSMLYSTFGPYPATPDQPPLPPRDSSEGSAAVAIREWLGDCRAGQLPMIQPVLRKSKKSPKLFLFP
jgi:hypothetical protein